MIAGALRAKIESVAAEALDEVLQSVLSVCRIPSPTFHEGERARYVRDRFAALGLEEPHIDGVGNAVAVLRGSGGGPRLLLAAHTDTVFPPGTDTEPRFDGTCWRAPGIKDNSASVGVLLKLPELLQRAGVKLAGDLILCGNVGEEGLGDLRGMRHLMQRYRDEVDAVLVVDGSLGQYCHEGICVRRYKVGGRARGGHSWSNFGTTSAIHVLARMAARISRLEVPQSPKTTYNVGTFQGGTSVNAIAEEAHFLLDMRSVEKKALATLEESARRIIHEEAQQPDFQLHIEVVSDRPGGRCAASHPVVRAVVDAYRSLGLDPRGGPGSTDGNIPLSLGIPTCSIGVSRGGGSHTLGEYLEPDSLATGTAALMLCLVRLQASLRR